jgi:uncharacterized Zn-binding protein involved in type VI secretion
VAVNEVAAAGKESYTKLSELKPKENPAAAVNKVGSAILGTINAGAELTKAGVAALTSPLAAALPAFPAAHLGSFYLGIPHAHLHPPSLVPPAPTPVPLPTMGAIVLGTSLQVLVGGIPAARAGDLGLAPTCGGLVPYFTVFLGSSKVFIGGTRAARQSDMCTACTPSTAGVARGLARAMQVASKAVAMAGIAGNVIDAMSADEKADKATSTAEAQEQAAVSAANVAAAAASSAQMAADSVATAASAMMGTDPAIPPGMVGFVTQGASNVLVGGMPMPNIPDPAQWLLKKLHAKGKLKLDKLRAKRAGGSGGCGR